MAYMNKKDKEALEIFKQYWFGIQELEHSNHQKVLNLNKKLDEIVFVNGLKKVPPYSIDTLEDK